VPLAVEFLGFEDGEFPVEKDIVPTHTRMEQFGKSQVAQFVRGHEDGEAEDKG
jgi:hypothetical protein